MGEGEMSDAIFTLTKRFTTSVGLINKIPTAKLGLVLERVVSNIDSGDAPFSEDENKKLCALFSLSEEEMASVLDALCFIFEQLAYLEVTSDQLTAHLSKTGITSDRVTCFVTIWTNQKIVIQIESQNCRTENSGQSRLEITTGHGSKRPQFHLQTNFYLL